MRNMEAAMKTNQLSLRVGALALAVANTVFADEVPLHQADEIVVTATRFKESSQGKPVSITVITQQEIQQSAAKTVPDLLAEQTGIVAHDLFGSNAANATVDMRGFGATGGQNTLILLDGRRVGDIDLSGVQWAAVPLSAIERIEIMRGSGAVLYGEGASAGVINIITKAPEKMANAMTIGAMAGSYGTQGERVNANYFGQAAGINVSADHFVSDGYRANNRNEQSNAQADMRWLTEAGEFALKVGADRQDIRLPAGRQVQPSIGLNQLADPRGTRTPLDYASRDGNRASLEWQRDTGWGEFNVGFGYRDKNQKSYFDQGGFPIYNDADLNVISVTPRIRILQPLLGLENSLVVGLDWYKWDYHKRISDLPGNIDQPHNTVRANQENTGLYLYDTLRLSALTTLSGGLRSEHLHISANDTFDPTAPGALFGSGAPAGTQTENQYAYELGLRHQISAAAALTGKFSRSFRFANVDEIYESSPVFTQQFQFLRPQTAKTMEIGLEQKFARGNLRSALFQTDVRDEIHLDPFTGGVGNTNLPPSRRRGLELDAKWRATTNVTLGAGYTYTEAKFLEGTFPGNVFFGTNISVAGKTVPLVPQHKLDLTGSWEITSQTRFNGVISYVSKQFMDNDEPNSLGINIPAYTVADIKLTHHVGPWNLSAAINNLFNRQYFGYAVRSNFTADRYEAYPLPERNASVRLEYTFK
ncbi:MAG: TonB-dependent receptor [Sulfuricella sp.]|nr:TonB-dependent receptor [Sulfuricella sp.]